MLQGPDTCGNSVKMKDGLTAAYSEPALMHYDETSVILSPRVRRQPMTYFVYPGLDHKDLKGFLLEHQASSACIQKAMNDLGETTPSHPAHNISDSISHMSSISDEVFIEEVMEQSTNMEFQELEADYTILDEVPLESEADDTLLTVQSSQSEHKLSEKSLYDVGTDSPTQKKKGLTKFFVTLCACGGLKSKKLKKSRTTEL